MTQASLLRAALESLVDGRALTWYGPAMIAAPEHLASSIRSALAR